MIVSVIITGKKYTTAFKFKKHPKNIKPKIIKFQSLKQGIKFLAIRKAAIKYDISCPNGQICDSGVSVAYF